MTTDLNSARIEKYRRVLALLSLATPFLTDGENVRLVLNAPSEDRCDLLIQVTSAIGRVVAQSDFQLDHTTYELPLTTRLKGGDYVLAVSPPLTQLHGIVPIELRLPFSVGQEGSLAQRRAEVSARARLPRNPTGATELLLTALWSNRVGADLPDLSQGAGPGLAGATCALIWDGTPTGIEAAICHVGMYGFDLTEGGLEREVVSLAALTALGPPQTADLALAVLDKLAFCLALGETSHAEQLDTGVREVLRSLRDLLFFQIPARSGQAADAVALVPQYVPPDIITAIAADPPPEARQWHQQNGGTAPHIRSTPCTADAGDTVIRISHGDQTLELDFTFPTYAEGSAP